VQQPSQPVVVVEMQAQPQPQPQTFPYSAEAATEGFTTANADDIPVAADDVQPNAPEADDSSDQNDEKVPLKEAEKPQTTPLSAESAKVKAWLTDTVGLPQYADHFICNGYDSFDFVMDLTDNAELAEIGIILKGHQSRLLKQIALLRNQTKGSAAEKEQQKEETARKAQAPAQPQPKPQSQPQPQPKPQAQPKPMPQAQPQPQVKQAKCDRGYQLYVWKEDREYAKLWYTCKDCKKAFNHVPSMWSCSIQPKLNLYEFGKVMNRSSMEKQCPHHEYLPGQGYCLCMECGHKREGYINGYNSNI